MSWQWGLEDAFCDIAGRGQREGEIPKRHPPRRVARFLVGAAQGLGVLVKAGHGRWETRELARMALWVLE